MGWKGAPTHLKDYITEETGQAAAVQFREETYRMTGALQPDPHTWHLSLKVCPIELEEEQQYFPVDVTTAS